MPKSGNALVVMAKAPIAGEVKTRLVPPLSLDEAAELYRCLLFDLLESFASFEAADRFIAFAPDDAAAWFNEIAPSGFACFPQRGEGLGKRMADIFERQFGQGYERVVIVGSDLPVFPTNILSDAFRTLERDHAVLGPARDGGYYLIGLNRMIPELFTDMPWGTARVFETTCGRLAGLGMKPAVMPEWFDVDTVEDLESLKVMDFAAGAQTRTAALLKKLSLRKRAHFF